MLVITRLILTSLLLLLLLGSCSTNPVTGKKNLNFMSESWEREVGSKLYYQSRQAQGGDFIVDERLSNYIKGITQRIARQARRELDWEIEIINSSVPNAWALPGGKMAINRGLLTRLNSEAELAAVLGHEIVHADAAHGAQAQSKGVLGQAGAMAAGIYLGSKTDSELARQAGILLPSLGVHLLNQKYGRDAEREADRYGIKYMSAAGFDPQGAVELQQTFVEISEGKQGGGWVGGLFASHPPSRERLENNRRIAAKLLPGGEIGRDRYQREIARLKKMQPAYDAYDDGRKALKKKDYSRAMSLANRAIRQLPDEALFYALKGDVQLRQKQYRQAEDAFSQAIRRNDGYFYPFLQRGLLRNQIGKRQAAYQDLQRAQRLAPTADASKVLGDLERAAGNIEAAVRHYRMATRSNSAAGVAAREELMRMGY